MRRLAWLAAPLTLASGAALAQAPFSFDAAPGRLPKNVIPQSYTISLRPDVRALTLLGREAVVLQFRSASALIQFDSDGETLRDVRLDGRAVRAVRSDVARRLTTVTLAAAAPAGLHRLTFRYRGHIQTQPVGLFAQHYVDLDGHARVMLSTQFEATDARRMFPCWDEPAFRARFRLTVTLPAAWAAVSNMPVAHRAVDGPLAITTFATTPGMPSYLLELSAGDLGHIESSIEGTRLGVWTTAGRQQSGATALANARQILADYDDYFGYRYPLPKLDSIAVPGGFSGAMENWGAITYQEGQLLLPPIATLMDRQQVYSAQAHEMAHQWNGDLVTLGWWDDLWLNESFASWMSARQTALRHPDWNWWQVQDADREVALSADAQPSAPPLEQTVTDEQQAGDDFDPDITYSKGQAVLRMFAAYLGPGVFRDGIRRYIRQRAFSNATPGDLWNALSAASGRDMAAIAGPWTGQAGFPIIEVASHCDAQGQRHLILSQQRFLLRGHARAAQPWRIPVQMRIGTAAAPQALLLVGPRQRLAAGPCAAPLSLDADALGFYRVRYGAAILGLDTRDFDQLPDGDRIALLDDQWALVQANRAALATYLSLPAAMGADLNARAWQQIAGALGTIESDERGSRGHDAFAAYARSVIAPVARRLGWDPRPGEAPDITQLRRTLLLDLGAWADAAVIDEARRRFARFQADQGAVVPDSLPLVLSLVAGDADQRTFDTLYRLAQQTHDPGLQQEVYSALMRVRDPRLAEQAARIALSAEVAPQDQDQPLRLSLLTELAAWHPRLAWTTFSAHADELLASYGSLEPLIIAQYVPQWFWNSLPPLQLDNWVRSRLPASMSPVIARGMQDVLFQRSEREALVPAADAYLRSLARHRSRPGYRS